MKVDDFSKTSLSLGERKAILSFLEDLQKENGEGFLQQLVLFGSKARGDSTKDADVDLLAIVKNKEAERIIYKVVAKMLSSFGVYLSVKTFPQGEFERLVQLKTPFMENITREGIVLWPKQ